MEAPEVLLETNDFLAINKPPEWVVNDSKTAHGNKTVQEWILQNFTFPLSQNSEKRNGVVHRLDKETSGVLLIAKNELAFYELQKQFSDRVVVKTYCALVHGELPGGGEVTVGIERMVKNRRKFGVSSLGRSAATSFELLHILVAQKGEKYSFVLLTPKTGRTHQIRVHMNYIHHPVVSDPLYLGHKTFLKDKEWCPRMFLHAKKLEFLEPFSKKSLTVEAPLPPDLVKALSFVK